MAVGRDVVEVVTLVLPPIWGFMFAQPLVAVSPLLPAAYSGPMVCPIGQVVAGSAAYDAVRGT